MSNSIFPKDDWISMTGIIAGVVMIIFIFAVVLNNGDFSRFSLPTSSSADETLTETVDYAEEELPVEAPRESHAKRENSKKSNANKKNSSVEEEAVAVEEVKTEEELPAENVDLGITSICSFKKGKNYFDANMIHTDGRKFPFTLSFNYNPYDGSFSNIIYKNESSETTIRLKGGFTESGTVKFKGQDNGKDFIMIFSVVEPFTGDAWSGKFHQDIELRLK